MSPPINLTNFEELLQCPVCFELPSGAIQQCEQGHAVCQNCYQKLTNCPVCRGVFYGTRNYVMEELIEKMKRGNTKPEKASDKPANRTTSITRRLPPPASSGHFPCKFPQCNQKVPSCRMLRHIRNSHSEILHESRTQDGLAFTRVMDILWVQNMRQVFAMQISDMGLFYLIIDNDALGIVRAWLQMVADHKIAQNFLYELNFHNWNLQNKTVFIDKVQSVNQPDVRFMSDTAAPLCTKLDKKWNIFSLKRECPVSRLHLAITFSNTFQRSIVPTMGTKLYKNIHNVIHPELNRLWRFDLSDQNNLLQRPANPEINPARPRNNIVQTSNANLNNARFARRGGRRSRN